MKIAIIGAGFAGLGLAWNLKGCDVTLFDPNGIGGGASGMAAGLLHPYVGEQCRRSLFATEGLEATEELITVAEKKLGRKVSRKGIVRRVFLEEQREMFLSHAKEFGDVEQVAENVFLIKSAVTVDCPAYLEGLWQVIEGSGAKLEKVAVGDLSELKGFDHIFVAAGAGSGKFRELSELKYRLVKGQLLICKAHNLPKQSSIAKGYIALSSQEQICHIGSTYERHTTDPTANCDLAKELLLPKIGQFFPEVQNLEVLECKSAMRLVRSSHYLPYSVQLKPGLWALTALGSRGLLYHALFGKQLAKAIR